MRHEMSFSSKAAEKHTRCASLRFKKQSLTFPAMGLLKAYSLKKKKK